MKLVIWSVIGAIAISAISPEPTEARRGGGFRRGNRSGLVRRQPYYRKLSYTIAQIDRSGAAPRAAPIQQRRQPQGERDERFPIRPEPNIRREAQSEVTEAKANGLRNYAGKQPYQAMRKLLGEPTQRIENGSFGAEVYNIKGSASPFQASRRLVIHYERSPECNCTRTTGWHQE